MSELSQIVEEKENRIRTLLEINKSMDYEVDEYLRTIIDATANITSRRQVAEENLAEVKELKTKLEEYEALRQ